MSALSLLNNFDYSASPEFSKNGSGLAAVRCRHTGGIMADYGERLEKFQADQRVQYRNPLGGKLHSAMNTPYIQQPYAPFDLPKFPLDFVPVNQFGIHRGFDVPNVNAYHTPILGNYLEIAEQLANEQTAAAEARHHHAHATDRLMGEYGRGLTEKVVESKARQLIAQGFAIEHAHQAMKEVEMERAKHVIRSHTLRPQNIHSLMTSSVVE